MYATRAAIPTEGRVVDELAGDPHHDEDAIW
jgi:hypothetical protein